ncbi:unnamed protein product, partial [Allacma fusca]
RDYFIPVRRQNWDKVSGRERIRWMRSHLKNYFASSTLIVSNGGMLGAKYEYKHLNTQQMGIPQRNETGCPEREQTHDLMLH